MADEDEAAHAPEQSVTAAQSTHAVPR